MLKPFAYICRQMKLFYIILLIIWLLISWPFFPILFTGWLFKKLGFWLDIFGKLVELIEE